MQLRFPIGRLLATPGALTKLTALNETPFTLLARHVAGDWDELDEEDKQTNDHALRIGGRLLSAYTLQTVRFWVITEADRHATTILLPEKY